MRDVRAWHREHSLTTLSAGLGIGFSERSQPAADRHPRIQDTAVPCFRAGSARRNCLLRFSSYIWESAIRSN